MYFGLLVLLMVIGYYALFGLASYLVGKIFMSRTSSAPNMQPQAQQPDQPQADPPKHEPVNIDLRVQKLTEGERTNMALMHKPARKPKRKSNYIRSGWTRHDAFSQILHEHPPRTEYRDGDIIVLNVKFNPTGHTYCYRADDDVYKPGDVVKVKVSGEPKAVTVDSVGYYSPEEYPFDVVQLNYVEGMASGELKKKYDKMIEEELAAESERYAIRKAAEERRKKIRAENDVIRRLKRVQEAVAGDEEIQAKLSALEIKMTKVIDKAEQMIDEDNPESVNEKISKLHAIYLPKTINVLEQYEDIFTSGLPADSLGKQRADLLEAISKSEQVYNNILISLYEKDMLELSSEMKALKTMFALSGLLDSDFDITE